MRFSARAHACIQHHTQTPPPRARMRAPPPACTTRARPRHASKTALAASGLLHQHRHSITAPHLQACTVATARVLQNCLQHASPHCCDPLPKMIARLRQPAGRCQLPPHESHALPSHTSELAPPHESCRHEWMCAAHSTQCSRNTRPCLTHNAPWMPASLAANRASHHRLPNRSAPPQPPPVINITCPNCTATGLSAAMQCK